MGKTFRYVKEFDFSAAGKPVGCEMMAKGGAVKPAAKMQTKTAAVKTPSVKREQMIEKANAARDAAPKGGLGMLRDNSKFGITGNKNPGIARKSVPVAPKQPMIAPYAKGGYAEGGKIPKAGAYKIPKVMSEFKSGELHSGSKTGPVVKSRKQAVAIALSEARAAGKKKG